jgi:hypothetical protein
MTEEWCTTCRHAECDGTCGDNRTEPRDLRAELGGPDDAWEPQKPCAPIPCPSVPCPSFEEVDLGPTQQIGWDGLDYPVIHATEPFISWTFPQQVDELWSMLTDHAAEVRRKHGYDDDVAITVRLPDNPQLNDVFRAVKERAVFGSPIVVTLACEEK